MEQLRLCAPPAMRAGDHGASPSVGEETAAAEELERRLRAAGAILATGAIRAVLKERSSHSAEGNVAQQDGAEGRDAADSSAAAAV
jgi:hypothetical protein